MDKIHEIIIEEVKRNISDAIDQEIEKQIRDFYNILIARKDDYIAQIMKGIRIAHEYNPEGMYMDYRITFLNLEKKKG